MDDQNRLRLNAGRHRSQFAQHEPRALRPVHDRILRLSPRLELGRLVLAADPPIDQDAIKGLPEQLRELIARSSVLHDKVRRLDATIHAPVPEEQTTATPLDRQIGLLKAAFERQDEPCAKP